MIKITDAAKEKIFKLLQDKGDGYFLRVGVKGGGCSGLSYSVDLDNTQDETDKVFEDQGIKIICDPKSFLYLHGITIDFSTELVGGGFQFKNPNASGSCGCGTSFSV